MSLFFGIQLSIITFGNTVQQNLKQKIQGAGTKSDTRLSTATKFNQYTELTTSLHVYSRPTRNVAAI